MKNLSILLLISLLVSCSGKNEKTTESDIPVETNATSAKEMTEETVVLEPEEDQQDGTLTVKAKFIEFNFGDSESYLFEDESGKMWDFAGSQSTKYEFGIELSETEANEDNQGWGSNKDLQGKWFKLTYVTREQEQYIDGPIVAVDVISNAVLIEN
jgi:hypothetical protein